MQRRMLDAEPDRAALQRNLAQETRLGLAPLLVLVVACLTRPPQGPAAPRQPASLHDLPVIRRWHPRASDLDAILDHPLLLADPLAAPIGMAASIRSDRAP